VKSSFESRLHVSFSAYDTDDWVAERESGLSSFFNYNWTIVRKDIAPFKPQRVK